MYVLFALLIIYQKHRIDFFTTYIQQRRGAIFFRLTTTDMSFEIHTTTVVEKDIYIYISPWRMVGPTRENIYATVGSVTWTSHNLFILPILCFLIQGNNL